MAKEKDVIIQQQKAELLQIKAEELSQRRKKEISEKEASAIVSEEEKLLKDAKSVEEEVVQIEVAPVTPKATSPEKPKKTLWYES